MGTPNKYLTFWPNKMLGDWWPIHTCKDKQLQQTVTAYFSSEQLLLFAFVGHDYTYSDRLQYAFTG